MDELLTQLRAAAEPTRLRLLALCARHPLCVTDLCAVLGQSQPRLSRHLKLLTDAGLLERIPEGSNAYFQMPADADLARMILARLPEDDPRLAADRRVAARLAAERAREASDAFRRHGMDWDATSSSSLPVPVPISRNAPMRGGRASSSACSMAAAGSSSARISSQSMP